MQEVYENFNLMSDVDFKAWMLNTDLLEKEKEVMESAWQDGMYECDGDGTFEDFYKTFNTKEK